jgi:hypothetical protein
LKTDEDNRGCKSPVELIHLVGPLEGDIQQEDVHIRTGMSLTSLPGLEPLAEQGGEGKRKAASK